MASGCCKDLDSGRSWNFELRLVFCSLVGLRLLAFVALAFTGFVVGAFLRGLEQGSLEGLCVRGFRMPS